MEPLMQRRFERLQQSVAETTISSISTGQANQTSALLYGGISQLIVVSIGASWVIDNRLTMGALVCCTLLSGQIFSHFCALFRCGLKGKQWVTDAPKLARFSIDIPLRQLSSKVNQTYVEQFGSKT